jgi:hypothetical protein
MPLRNPLSATAADAVFGTVRGPLRPSTIAQAALSNVEGRTRFAPNTRHRPS